MALPLYLAMTAAEIRENSNLPPKLSYMACHFSPYGTGLSNLPKFMPQGSMLILNDRTPIHGHDPIQIQKELESVIDEFHCSALLLDFQRPGWEDTAKLVHSLCALPCPVGVSESYAQDISCPVFLPPTPLDVSLTEYLQPWNGREIWLEAALDAQEITMAKAGYSSISLHFLNRSDGFYSETLHCHYHIDTSQESAKFTLFRTRSDLDDLLAEAETFGVTQAVGLWQELK